MGVQGKDAICRENVSVMVLCISPHQRVLEEFLAQVRVSCCGERVTPCGYFGDIRLDATQAFIELPRLDSLNVLQYFSTILVAISLRERVR